jgi:hypothetical protein
MEGLRSGRAAPIAEAGAGRYLHPRAGLFPLSDLALT